MVAPGPGIVGCLAGAPASETHWARMTDSQIHSLKQIARTYALIASFTGMIAVVAIANGAVHHLPWSLVESIAGSAFVVLVLSLVGRAVASELPGRGREPWRRLSWPSWVWPIWPSRWLTWTPPVRSTPLREPISVTGCCGAMGTRRRLARTRDDHPLQSRHIRGSVGFPRPKVSFIPPCSPMTWTPSWTATTSCGGPRSSRATFGRRRIAFVTAPGGIRLEFMEQLAP